MKMIQNQVIAFFVSKIKTFIIAHIKSKRFSRSKAVPEILIVRPLYVRSQHVDQKRHFIFSDIAE